MFDQLFQLHFSPHLVKLSLNTDGRVTIHAGETLNVHKNLITEL